MEAGLAALELATAPSVLLAVVVAIPVGLLLGLLPGLSGLAALAVLMPFVYGMSPLQGLAFLLAAHAVVYTGGSVTAILLGIPGAPPNAATLIDGVPMRNRGLAGRAIGAALTASALGGVFGAAVLAALLPAIQPIVFAFGPPETLMLAMVGLTFLAVLGGRAPLLGLFSGALGIFFSTVGYEPVSGVPRYWMGSEYLLDGFRLIPLALGLFALPEILNLMSGGSLSVSEERLTTRQVLAGAGDVVRHKWLAMRSSAIGALIGIVPGVGGETATFVAYGAARQSSRDPARYGSGVVEGVIAPEASNNAKEGGSLVPTLALGVPGSAGMALMLGAFLVLGLQPGPGFLVDHLDIGLGLVIVLAVANLLAAAVMIALAPLLTRVMALPVAVLAPCLLALSVLGTFATTNDLRDVLAMFAFGGLGVLSVLYGLNRPALLLGFVLGPIIERYLAISLNVHGLAFLFRPICLVLLAVMVSLVLLPLMRARWRDWLRP